MRFDAQKSFDHVSSCDIVPTILSALRVEVEFEFDGNDLFQYLQRFVGISSLAAHGEHRVGFDQLLDTVAYDRVVIHHENFFHDVASIVDAQALVRRLN